MNGCPNLASYDIILINTSGGKDSQTMMRVVVDAARRAGVLDRVVAVHADLGRVEWRGTKELAREQAEHYDLRFEVVARPQGDLLDHIEKRGKFPGRSTRFCTSDHKRAQVRKVMTMLVREAALDRPARLLNCMGLRAQESRERARKDPFSYDESASGKGKVRQVWNWLPIFDWTTDEVWADVHASGVRYHEAYDAGMPRLSCVFCVLAGPSSWLVGAQHNPELAATYAEVEERIGHSFTPQMSMATVILRASRETVTTVADWAV